MSDLDYAIVFWIVVIIVFIAYCGLTTKAEEDDND